MRPPRGCEQPRFPAGSQGFGRVRTSVDPHENAAFDPIVGPHTLILDSANSNAGGAGRLSNPKDAAGDARIPLWLLSSVAKIQWALAQFAGLLKYGAWNWRVAGVRTSTYLSAIERHLEGYKSGETVDPVDGTHHLGNIMACCALILDAEAAGKLTDDRPPSVDHRPTIADGEALMARLRDQYKDRAPRHWSIADSAAGEGKV